MSESLISRSHFGKPGRPKRANSGYGESRDILWLCRALKNAFSLKQVKMYTGLSEDSLNKFLH
ncbi:hypothetical protein [Candidatus Williamhamiltonella defendens]|uniref:hypothetical protein n=1 Tax=Candidatus Williamhamiltonella defendens TaxID=138072 RepID=UPI0002F49644|nr:hypothetical protein [Candidatus Hamiltonella defensa]